MEKNKKFLLLAAVLLLILVYANTFKVPLYFDDAGIVTSNLKINDLSLKTLSRICFKSITRNRPLANLSLAINYTLAGDPSKTSSFHVVNIAVHILCFVFVFLFIQKLLGLPSVPQKYKKNSFPLALAAAVLWAVHPIQTQAVTYIVQRMSSLAALFYFISLYYYLKAREGGRRLNYFASGAAFLLALGSKEIAATLPIMIILIEGIFFKTNKKKLIIIFLIATLLILSVSYLFISGPIRAYFKSSWRNHFPNRDFSASERLLTQPRIFVHYISLTLLPFYLRQILEYDFRPSRSLVFPWPTLPCLIFVLATIGLGFAFVRKKPLVSFCIFSFWLGHAIEGSIFNLELAFEHRMYLPSVFLIFFAVLVLYDLSVRIRLPKKYMTIALGVLVVYLAANTFLRNELWRDPVRFYENNIKKTSSYFRPYHNLGTAFIFKGEYEKALDAYQKAIALNPDYGLSYFGVGQAYALLNEHAKAIPYFEKAIERREWNVALSLGLIGSYLKFDRYEDVLRTAVISLQRFPGEPELMLMTGLDCFYLIEKLGKSGIELLAKYGLTESAALGYLEKAHASGNRDLNLYLNLSTAYVKMADQERNKEKKAELIGKGEKILAEGIARFPFNDELKKNQTKIDILGSKWDEVFVREGKTKENLNMLALNLMNAGQFGKALEVLKEAQSRFGLDPVLEFNQAICWYYLGREEDAVKVFRRIIETTSDKSLRTQADYFIKDWEKKKISK